MTIRADAAILRLAHGALGPRRVEALLDRYRDPVAAVAAVVEGRTSVSGAARQEIAMSASARAEALAAAGIAFDPAGTGPTWQRLGRYPWQPRWLFRIGHVPDLPVIAIVGTRTCTTYGEDLAEAYGRAAAEAGWLVVSGMAKGIDGAAHRGALDAGSPTVAVLGSGIDVVYPRRHRELYGRIANAGAILSEYPPGTRPDAWRFPTRNRIIACMSDVVLVVEAGVTGGALITARVAVDNGIPVFATPGDVDRVASSGTNALIRDGAFPVFGAGDLREVLDLVVPMATGFATGHDAGSDR